MNRWAINKNDLLLYRPHPARITFTSQLTLSTSYIVLNTDRDWWVWVREAGIEPSNMKITTLQYFAFWLHRCTSFCFLHNKKITGAHYHSTCETEYIFHLNAWNESFREHSICSRQTISNQRKYHIKALKTHTLNYSMDADTDTKQCYS